MARDTEKNYIYLKIVFFRGDISELSCVQKLHLTVILLLHLLEVIFELALSLGLRSVEGFRVDTLF